MTNNKNFTIVILFTISIMFLIRCATKSSKEDRASIPLIKFELVGVEETNYPEYEVYSANAKKALVKDAPGTINLFAIESDLERDGLNGKIKSIRSMEFHAIRKNGKIIKEDTTVREWNNHFKTFNEFGNLTEDIRYSVEQYDYEKPYISYHLGYRYLEFEKQRFDYNYRNKILSKDIYDKSGNHIMTYHYGGPKNGGITFLKYDKERNLIEDAFFNRDGMYLIGISKKYEIEYDYNEDGLILEERKFNTLFEYEGKPKYLYRKKNYHYDKNGKVIKSFTTAYNYRGGISNFIKFDKQ
jgi:hypothetical protein